MARALKPLFALIRFGHAVVGLAALCTLIGQAVRAQDSCGAACVFAGPRMASVESSEAELLGPILSGLLGTDISLSVLDWNAMAGANIDLLGLLGDNGTDVTVSDPGQVLNVDLTLLELVEASAAVAQADGDTALVDALNALSLPVGELTQTINLADLITVALTQGALANIDLNVLDLIGGAIQLYNYENVVTTTQPVALNNEILEQFGIGGAEILLQVVEPPHFECGGAGTQFHTSTVRAKVSVDLAGTAVDTSALDATLGPLVGGAVTSEIILGDLDLYFEFGRVDGTILSADPTTKTASVILAPSAIDLFLGGIDDAVFFNRSRPILQSDVDYATIGRLDVALAGGLVQESAGIRVKSFAQSAPPVSETLFFSPPYPRRQSIGDGASSFSDLIGTLARNLDVEVEDSLGNQIGPLIDTTVEPLVGEYVGGLLVDTVSPLLDLTVDPLLGFFGVGIGEAEASVSGVTSICTDYADCPVSGSAPDGVATANYGSPYHFIYETLYLGTTVPDTDAGPLGNATARGDDDSGVDDEDGVTLPALPAGTVQTLEIRVVESGGETGYLQAWVDWNGDGAFGADEQIASDVTAPSSGVIALSVTVPATARAGNSFARFRWSSRAGLDPVQIAPDGEVEDHAVAISGLPRPRLSGQVFTDAGTQGAIAHDGIQSGGETGLGEVTVVIETLDGTVLAVAVTDELGLWSASLPAGYTGAVVLRTAPPKGFIAISETTDGMPEIIPSAPNDGRITLVLAADSDLEGLGIGLVPQPRLSQDSVVYTQSAQITLLSHDYSAGSSGSVSFSVENLSLPSTGAASVALFYDEACDGQTGALVSGPRVVESGDRICLISRVATSSGLPDGAAITYQLVADTALRGIDKAVRLENTDRIIIGRQIGGIVVEKTVENLTQSSGESRFNTAGPADVLLYRIRIVNTGTTAVHDVKVQDMTPPHTRLAGQITRSVQISDGTECTLALPAVVNSGYVGSLKWMCEGEVQPGSTATFEFTARIND
ncbi:GEVED domain-containing protein [Neptunicoccus sediminis]|uniref:GEVED domain-containing protein n=1 Tax=Neptunicoccus sediminis TaxID=1892596 RepID=UPI0012FF8A80|nr:GEVED domain-containing protein [Neptunicoccus sediminis]